MPPRPPEPPEVKAARPERKPSVWHPEPIPTRGIGRSTEDPRTPMLKELAARAVRASLAAEPDAAERDVIDPQWTTPGGGAVLPAAPGGAPAAKSAGALTADQQKLQDIKALLHKSPTGRDALAYMDAQKVGVAFLTGKGGYWEAAKRQMVIDRTYSTEFSALVMVHEAHHARMSLSGATGSILTQTRADYVKTMLNEEAVGTALSIRTKRELMDVGVPISAVFALEPQYTKAHDAAIRALEAANPKASTSSLIAAGQAAGLQRVIQGFTAGAVPTSTTKEPYPQYYGNAWDAAHKAGGK